MIAARLTGAGFGCTVNLVRTDGADAVGREVVARYARGTGIETPFWVSKPAQGAAPLPL